MDTMSAQEFREYRLGINRLLMRGATEAEQPEALEARRQGAAWAAEHPAAAGDEGVYAELTAVYRESALARTRHLPDSPADGMARDAALFEAAWIVGALER